MNRDSGVDTAFAVMSVLRLPASKPPMAVSSERRCIGNLLIDSVRGDAGIAPDYRKGSGPRSRPILRYRHVIRSRFVRRRS